MSKSFAYRYCPDDCRDIFGTDSFGHLPDDFLQIADSLLAPQECKRPSKIAGWPNTIAAPNPCLPRTVRGVNRFISPAYYYNETYPSASPSGPEGPISGWPGP